MNESKQVTWSDAPLKESEAKLVAAAQAADADPSCSPAEQALLWFQAGRRVRALTRLRRFLAYGPANGRFASACVSLGCNAEQVQDYESAVVFYREARRARSTDPDTWYFTNNNLGFSLNQLGQFTSGAKFCRSAIAINPNYSNGHKNLGLALVGQGRWREAADSFAQAIRVMPEDPRSLVHLRELLRQRPELLSDYQRTVQDAEKVHQRNQRN